MKYKKSLLIGLAMVSGIVLFSAGSALARINEDIVIRNDVGVALSPMMSDRMDLKPGSVVEGKFRVRYPASETTEVFAEVSPYAAGEGDNYESGIFNKSSVYTKMTEWVTLDLEECTINKREAGRIYFTMRQQEECFVTYKIAVPKDAYGGSQHVAIFVQTVPNENTEGGGAIINSYRIGYLIKNDIDGPGAKAEGKVVEIKIPGFFLFVPPITTSSLVENTGSLDFEADQKVTIKSYFGDNEVYSEERKVLVMAETERLASDKWEDTPQLGLFKVTVETTVLGETTVLNKTVLVIPVALIVAIVVGILLLALWIYFKVKKSKEGNSSRKSKK